ncbi:hypothetical protein RUM43_012420 [Polyplax serrata]|uniref:Uncharacterized protein n=1 Tax=Polyplax serrata TaxID=468196 RepID=A0AAN8RSY4_POLSC
MGSQKGGTRERRGERNESNKCAARCRRYVSTESAYYDVLPQTLGHLTREFSRLTSKELMRSVEAPTGKHLSQRKVWAPLQGSISPLGQSRSATALQCRRGATAALQSQAVGPVNGTIHGWSGSLSGFPSPVTSLKLQ